MLISDEFLPLVKEDAHNRFVFCRNQYHDLERRFGVGHPDAMKAKELYDQAVRFKDEVDPGAREQVAA